jgi:putative membrane-bound dehydrogenase-like protein
MPTIRFARALALGAILLATTEPAPAQVSPEESAKRIKVAPGLEATLWAAEPLVVNPTNIDIDSRGRVWVTEGLNYRLTRGGNRKFPRIEDADKIKILEDTDGDGKADKVTVFADRIFPVPMGIAVEEFWSKEGKYQGCKVYIGNSPDLLVLEDTDGDDVADKRYPLLTGFGGVDSDHGVHGMTLGPDGKLYFTHGDGCCSVQQDHSEKVQNFDVVDQSGRHVSTDQLATVLRCNRDGTQFEILATRLRNDYECCVDSFGNIFVSDNDDDGNRGSRVVWVMDGGKYGYRTPGSPRHWGEDVPGNIPKLAGTGNGSPCGIMIYEGVALGEEFDNSLFEVDAGTRQVNWFPLTRVGAGFRTEAKVLLSSDDPYFRPVDACAAPDGAVFVPDWYDAGVGGHAFTDQETGRIYRVAPKQSTTTAPTDFGTIAGLVSALRSPNVATRDVARRLLIEHGEEGVQALRGFNPQESIRQLARVMWVAGDIPGSDMRSSLARAMEQRGERFVTMDPRFRELAVRITADREPLEVPALVAMADDTDPGVRRAVLLALRNQPTSAVGVALRKLAASWDGQDRWYLEALGLALRHREPEFIQSLFDGSLYGDLELDNAGRSTVALPPYFPVDRNEAFLSVHDTLPPATALSKTLGLMWELHRVESLSLLTRLMPALKSPELLQAADDIIAQVEDSAGAGIVAELALEAGDPVRRRQIMASLTRKLDGPWRDAAGNPQIERLIATALDDPALRTEAITLAGVSASPRFADQITQYAEDAAAPPEVRVAAVEALARARNPQAAEVLDRLIAAAKESRASNPAAEAAVRALPRLGAGRARLEPLMTDDAVPLALRREALRGVAQQGGGARTLLAMARENTLPESLRLEAATLLRGHPDRRVRDAALELFPIKMAGGAPLPSLGELMRREGDAERGRNVFFTAGLPQAGGAAAQSCGSCHRVQGQGQWIGPDLSTIGTKYGKDELLRSILNPSAAIGYNFRSVVAATADGRVVTGLPVEDTPDRLVLKTADGQRVRLNPSEIDERTLSDVSLMPEGLTEALSEQDLVDLLAFLATLRQPVSIVGVADAAGPFAEEGSTPSLVVEPGTTLPTNEPLRLASGESAWRRITADAEGRFDLSAAAGADAKSAAYIVVPIRSPAAQSARLVIDTRAEASAWLDGKPLALLTPDADQPRQASVELPSGASQLVLRVAGGGDGGLVVTLVSDQPLEFSPQASDEAASR